MQKPTFEMLRRESNQPFIAQVRCEVSLQPLNLNEGDKRVVALEGWLAGRQHRKVAEHSAARIAALDLIVAYHGRAASGRVGALHALSTSHQEARQSAEA